MGPENWALLQCWGCQNPVYEVYRQKSFRQTSQHLKGNNWTEWQYHGAQTQLHKIQHHCFVIPHSQIWIHYHYFYLPRRTFMSSHPKEHVHSANCYTQLVFLVALTGYLLTYVSFLLLYLAHLLVLLWQI
jgi:hypothetical protein